MLPFTETAVPEIDLAGGTIVVDPPADCARKRTPGLRSCGAHRCSRFFRRCFRARSASSLAGKALAAGTWSLETIDIRNFGIGAHRTVDDTPAGGGPGMVMKADVLASAIDSVAADTRPRLLMSPRGTPLTQAAGRGPFAQGPALFSCADGSRAWTSA